ncbi:Crp/Fnr family transcriptional regulator, partial [Acidithiobacillus thiooxidans]|uniref:Crp/Fnr family transcriptional regulator n=1 Tax=Acidithiobacillus thiooxidans TaxID=930 RepID=UPI001D026D48
ITLHLDNPLSAPTLHLTPFQRGDNYPDTGGEQRPQSMRQMLARLSMRLHFLVKELRQLSVESAEQRLVSYLLDLCPALDAAAVVELPAKKSAVAARLGLTPETLSRLLSRMRKAGLITVNRRVLDIPDPRALQCWAAGH